LKHRDADRVLKRDVGDRVLKRDVGDRVLKLVLFVLLFIVASVVAAHAYVGPGAGFALVSSFLTLVIAFFTAFLALITLPVRMLWRSLRRRRPPRKARYRKVVVLGLDGLDPLICEKLMAEGELPNFTKLKERGTYRRLGTANPSMSPVAWSSFATGSDASHHGIFDFLTRDRRSYLPMLSSSAVYGETRFLRLGPFSIPYKKGGVRFLRRSVSFWKILSDFGVFSTVLRVPITFPPERINGLILAGMDVPDLRGSMGTFTYYTQSSEADKIGGMVIKLPGDGLPKNGNPLKTTLPGPTSPMTGRPLELDMTIRRSNGLAEISIGGETVRLKEREYSPWVRLTYKAAANVKMTGIVRFYVTQLDGDFGLYVTPIHIDPDKPVMPVSSPAVYSTYLSKLLGPFGTLGLAEDTWAVNERVLDEDAFIKQAYLYHEERRRMWFHTLDKLRKGFACVLFDWSDRLQHMCFRYLDDNHPANDDKDTKKYKDALYNMYRDMDTLVGETLEYEDDNTAVFVISDHGFKTFQRGVNLNSWLRDNGYLTLKEGRDGNADYLTDVDFEKTRAYAVGLGGIYINLKGRERHGVIDPSERQALKDELKAKLFELLDAQRGQKAVSGITDTAHDFKGPYRNEGPDLLIGFSEGYRVSWDCARGLVVPDVFEDNVKSWSGDHCMDPRIVPGILFTNLVIDDESPSLMDMAPTVLDLVGIDTPGHMVGKSLVKES
jgi:predicted AlkP superfamily phosphohydrolase/phosphomutase